ncbi:MAG: acyl-phosphate glycerol 3-phosphate acyltransferase [Rhodothermaceae bacterium]|nr:acyl-phosphate glycerol 3-phosphate acyltransferase [Rhodothermaceae bacterium]MBC15172.1 acyl-phosphate glycerol 3-phosphate acyltransferase [Rhodothermaceae bacterium]
MHSGHGAPSIFPSPLSPAPVASLVLIVVLSYLLGAIPFSLVVGRMMGVDLRQHGSGNAGATNALRVLGKGPGLLVFALDFGKGLAAVVLISQLRVGDESLVGLLGSRPELAQAWAATLAGTAAMVGHVVTLWGRLFFGSWKGGKGVATGAGMLTGLAPIAVGLALLVFIATLAATRYVSLGSILAAISLPLSLVVLQVAFGASAPPPVWIFATVVPAFIVWTHRANVKRLMNGTETRIGAKAT